MTSSPWYDCAESISSVVINYGATSISDWAFADCSNLKSISIPDSVESTGDGTFAGV